MVFLVVFIDLLGFGVVIPVLPRYGEFFAASRPMLVVLMASFSAMQFLFAPLWGESRIGSGGDQFCCWVWPVRHCFTGCSVMRSRWEPTVRCWA